MEEKIIIAYWLLRPAKIPKPKPVEPVYFSRSFRKEIERIISRIYPT